MELAEKQRNKRRAYADKRKELGFLHVPDEVDDPVLDDWAI